MALNQDIDPLLRRNFQRGHQDAVAFTINVIVIVIAVDIALNAWVASVR
jgi:hypothetical protein